MVMSGTSIAAPAVSGAVALMLEANPGLTPPLIKAMLQYSAQPLPNANLLQQGAGVLNVDGSAMLGASSSIGKTGVFPPRRRCRAVSSPAAASSSARAWFSGKSNAPGAQFPSTLRRNLPNKNHGR